MTSAAGGATPLAEDGLPTIAAVLRREGLTPKRALGQNFLLDLSLTRRIARAGDAPLGEVVEIGPGPGALTRALLAEGAEHVIAIERDRRCLPALQEIAAHWPGKFTLLEGDALTVDPRPHFRTARPQIIANLPYNIGTALLVAWLRDGGDARRTWWRRATVMLQREVAERIVAEPGGKAHGRLAVLARWRGAAELCFDVSPKAFTPPPKVTSAVVSLRPADRPQLDAPLEALERVTAAAFSQRRKMLRSSLKGYATASQPIEALLESAAVSPTLRADAVSAEDFARIARAVAARSG
ncbi:MAG: 16S rRNA (adenine(1518)-N(6)/adenine(1519)-N(6))-dimethyltransferase RsmA [Pseudomonadota bacterium]